MNTENTVVTVQDLEGARELGRLSGEVRVLKWGAAIVVTMMFAYLTFLSQQISGVRSDLTQQISEVRVEIRELRIDLTQQINEVRSDLTQQIDKVRSDLTHQINEVRSDLSQQSNEVRSDLTQQFNGLQEGQASIRERMTVVEQRLVADSS